MQSIITHTAFRFVAVAVVLTMAFAASSQSAHAQTYYNYSSFDSQHLAPTQETIAYLQQIVALLLAQLQAQGGGYQYHGNSDVDVETGLLRTSSDEVTFFGEVDLNRASYARVWFEYGEDEDFDERTRTQRVNYDDRFDADVDKDEFEEDEWYDYRAVAEDPDGRRAYGGIRSFMLRDNDSHRSNDDDPEVTTEDADEVDDDRAELNGEVDMNDFNNGLVFFVYGEDEDQVEDVEDDYDSYYDIDEDGDDLQKVRVDSDLDGRDDYSYDVTNLDEDTEYFFQICVEYEDEDDDEVLECGGVEEFETDDDNNNSNDDEPDVTTERAENIGDDNAELNGEVDMNDYNNGLVFFVYGEDEDQVEDIEDDYDTYDEVDEDGDDLQKVAVDYDLDHSASYARRVTGLDDNTDYYFQICVEYEDDDDDDVIECGGVEDFETDD